MAARERDTTRKCSSGKMTETPDRSGKTNEQVRVLVADDDDNVRDLIVALLQNKGYLVSSAADGKEAMEIITNGDVDVALLDVKMPNMSGIEVLRKAKETDPEMEVVLITGFADTDIAVEAIRCRAYDFIKKPFEDVRQIPAVVRRAMEKRRMARQNARLTEEVSRQNRFLREKLAELTLLYEVERGDVPGF